MTFKVMNTPRRLHPLVALFASLKVIKDMFIPLMVVLIGTFIRGNENRFSLYELGVWVAIFLLTVLWGIIHWRTFTYRIEEGELRVEKGVLIKEKKYIPLEKIHSIDFTESMLHQVFGVVKVQMQTAGGIDPEVKLTAVTKEEGERLKQEILAWNKTFPSEEEGEATVEITMNKRDITTKELLITGLTSGKIGIILSGVITLFSFLSQIFEGVSFTDYLPQFSAWQGYVVLGIVVLVITWVISVVYTIILYGNFTVQRKEDKLLISYGILERKQFTISLFRIQSVKVVEGILRQPLGYVTLHLVYAGGEIGQPENVLLFPLMKKEKVVSFLQTFLPDYAEDLEVKGLPKRAKSRYVFWNTIPVLPVVVVLIYFFPIYGLLSLLLLLMGALFGVLKFRDAGFALKGNKVIFRSRTLARTTGIIPRLRIQSHLLQRSYFQGRKGLATFLVSVASSFAGESFTVKDLDVKDGEMLFETLTKRE